MEKTILGIDIGGSYVKFGVFSLKGELLKRTAEKTKRNVSGEEALKRIAKTAKALAPPETIAGVGIGVPAPVTKGVVENVANLNWGNIDVQNTFKRAYAKDALVVVENDASLAAFGEYKSQKDPIDPYVLITLGTGVGGGIVLKGELLRGAAGEIGHMNLQKNGPRCGCGKRGCLEAFAGAAAMKKRVKERLKKGEKSVLKGRPINVRSLFEAAEKGDALALSVVDEAADALAFSLASISALLNPPVFVFGGGVAEAGAFLFEKIENRMDEYLFFGSVKPKLEKARLGNDAGITGAMEMVKHVQSDSQ